MVNVKSYMQMATLMLRLRLRRRLRLMLMLMLNFTVVICGKLDFPIRKSRTQIILAQLAAQVIAQTTVLQVENVCQHVTFFSSHLTIMIKHVRPVTLPVLRDE